MSLPELEVSLKLPNGTGALVPEAKLTEYLLSTTHPLGRAKARFFERLGYPLDDPEALRQSLLGIAVTAEMQEIEFAYGKKDVGAGTIVSPAGRSAVLVTVWVIILGDTAPILVTAYPG